MSRILPERRRLLLARARDDERAERLAGRALERHGADDAPLPFDEEVERARRASLGEERLDSRRAARRGRDERGPAKSVRRGRKVERGRLPAPADVRDEAGLPPRDPLQRPRARSVERHGGREDAARGAPPPPTDRRRGPGRRRRTESPAFSRITAVAGMPFRASATHFTDANERRFASLTSWSLRSRRTPRSSKRKTVPASSFPACALSTVQSWSVFWSAFPTSALVPGSSAMLVSCRREALLEADLVRPDEAGQVRDALADALLGGVVRAPRPDRDRGAERRDDEDRRADEELRREADAPRPRASRSPPGRPASLPRARRASARRPAPVVTCVASPTAPVTRVASDDIGAAGLVSTGCHRRPEEGSPSRTCSCGRPPASGSRRGRSKAERSRTRARPPRP